jgi:hypothetical protein
VTDQEAVRKWRPRQPLTRAELVEQREELKLLVELRGIRELLQDNQAALRALLRQKGKA